MKKKLLLDMYGVIIEESKGNFIPYTLQHFPVSEHEELIRKIKVDQLFTKAGNGELTSDAFLRQMGYQDTDFAMKDYLSNYLTLDPKFRSFAERVKNKYDLVLLSNDVFEWSEFLSDYYKINDFFTMKIVSGAIHYRKPQIEIFTYAMEQLKCSAEDCIFVDNSVKNLDAAERLGMVPVLFNRDKEDYDGIVVNNFGELEAFL